MPMAYKSQWRKNRICIQINGLKVHWHLYVTRNTPTRRLHLIPTERATHDSPWPWITTKPRCKRQHSNYPFSQNDWKLEERGKHYQMRRSSSQRNYKASKCGCQNNPNLAKPSKSWVLENCQFLHFKNSIVFGFWIIFQIYNCNAVPKPPKKSGFGSHFWNSRTIKKV